MKNKSVDDKLLFWSLFNIISPFPSLSFTATWSLLIAILFRFNDTSVIITILSALPMLVCPVCCVAGFVFGFKHKSVHKKRATVCMCLSAGGLVEYILVLMLLSFLASIG